MSHRRSYRERRRSSRTTSRGTSRSPARTRRRGSSRARCAALRARGFTDSVCVQNKTVVTDAFKGEDLNGYVPIFKRYDIPVRYNFKPEDMTWSVYRPKREDERPRQDLPRGHPDPGRLPRHEHRPPADGEVPHLHDDDRRDEERVRRAAQHEAPLHALVDPRDARRPARDPEGDPRGPVRGDGRHDRRRRPGAAHDAAGDQGRDARVATIRSRSMRSPRR